MNKESTLFLNLGRKMCAKEANESLEENRMPWKHDIFSYSTFFEILSEQISKIFIWSKI